MAALPGAMHPLEDLAALLGDAQIVLLGEATHGTHEFYAVRAELTRRLISEHGFRGVAVEADWPAAARAHRYVRGRSEDGCAEEALGDFLRFPQWMWRNPVIVDLLEWLRRHGRGAGFYGLDIYSLCESMHAVIDYLDRVDPAGAARARRRYACFEGFDELSYGEAAASGLKDPCQDAVVEQLRDLRELRNLRELRDRAGAGSGSGPVPVPGDADDCFAAEQNAKLAADAERYYLAMYQAGAGAWNLRDAHMADTLDALHHHLGGAGVVVWAHNSHVGDARATEMGRHHGEVSLGQLARERHGAGVRLVGFTTHAGTVTAARDWGGPAESRELLPSLPGSLERLLHDGGVRAGVLDLRASGPRPEERLIERMVGVVYRPEAEIWSHYIRVQPVDQFDLLVHLDQTTALEPLEPAAALMEPAETYPSGW